MHRNRLLQLLSNNRRSGPRQFAAKKTGDEATVYLYDMIVGSDAEAQWWGGVSPEAFSKAWRDIDASTINLRINSPGGDVFAARAIEQAIREHPANVIAHIDGLAASAASFVALAADEVRIAPGAFYMIHKGWTIAMGNADDFLSIAALLEKVDGTLADSYAKKSGMKRDELLSLMAAETWYTGAEAVEAGFADRLSEDVEDEEKDDETSKAKALVWDLSAYEHAPSAASDKRALTLQVDSKALGEQIAAVLREQLGSQAGPSNVASPKISHSEARARARLLSKEFA